MPDLPIVVTVDVDPDWRIPHGSGTPFRGEIAWTGLVEGVPQMLDAVKGLVDSAGRRVRFTWLLRSDPQIAALLGDPSFLAEEFKEFWRERIANGDEIGWHPHTWRYSDQHKVWYQEQGDLDWVRLCFKEGHKALSRHFRIRSAKPGWMYHDNWTMQIFDELKVDVDLAAVPGVAFFGSVPGTNLPLWTYDWRDAPQEPFHPSAHHYQRPGIGDGLGILEVPNWTFPMGRLRRAHHRIRGRSARDFANPAKTPLLVKEAFMRPPATVPFVCTFHPEELLGRSRLFTGQHVFENISALLDTCKRKGLQTKMAVASELPSLGGW